VSDDRPRRMLPELTERSRFFWEAGRQGRLLVLRCQRCGYYLHPPGPLCPVDHSKDLAPEAVSGRGRVASFTVDHHRWLPAPEPPYVIALVELAEQEALRLTTNLVGCPPGEVRIGMEVEVTFDHQPDPEGQGDVWLPMFRPLQDDRGDHGEG
jgi:uncharacterized OB-fold protein